MFFKNYLNGLSDQLDIKFKSHQRPGINSADKGELCELFTKDFLNNYLENHYKIFRGGNVVNILGEQSPQLDIVLTNKNTLKIFDDKGIYPIETLTGVFSVTSNLTFQKFKEDITLLTKIPKRGYCFHMEKFFGDKFTEETHKVWINAIPFLCVFGFDGGLNEKWIDELNNHLENTVDKSLCPTIVMVNKKGMFEKFIKKDHNGNVIHYYEFVPLTAAEIQGYAFSKILLDLYNMSAEQNYRRPDYGKYFEADY
jgi:hypothetical protein